MDRLSEVLRSAAMHLRRVLILMAMVLLLTAVVVAVAPPKRRQVQGAVGIPPAPPARSAAPI